MYLFIFGPSTDISFFFFFLYSSGNSQSAEQEHGRGGAAEGEGGGLAETAGETLLQCVCSDSGTQSRQWSEGGGKCFSPNTCCFFFFG